VASLTLPADHKFGVALFRRARVCRANDDRLG
jgi:hypothetical protein